MGRAHTPSDASMKYLENFSQIHRFRCVRLLKVWENIGYSLSDIHPRRRVALRGVR